MATGIPARLTRAEGRRFALTVGGAFLVLAALGWWRGRGHLSEAMALLGLALVCAGLAVPGRLTFVYGVWMGSGRVLSRITTPVFLGIVYYGLLTPVGLLMRLFGRRTLARHASAAGFWLSRDVAVRQRKDMERQF